MILETRRREERGLKRLMIRVRYLGLKSETLSAILFEM